MREGKGGERREKKEERGRREGKEGEMAREKERRRMEARGTVPWTQCIQTSSATQNVTLSIPVMLSALAGETFAWT